MIAILVLLVLVVGILYPNVFTFIGSFFPNGSFSIEPYVRFFNSPSGRQAFANSLFISVATVALSALAGVPLAFLLHRYDFRGRRLLRALAAAPVLLPPLVGVIRRKRHHQPRNPDRVRISAAVAASSRHAGNSLRPRIQHVCVLLYVYDRRLGTSG